MVVPHSKFELADRAFFDQKKVTKFLFQNLYQISLFHSFFGLSHTQYVKKH